MTDRWEEDVRRKMDSYEEQPPQVSWHDIDKALAERRKDSSARIAYMWRRRIAVAAAVVLAVVVVRLAFVGVDNAAPTSENSAIASHAVKGETAERRGGNNDVAPNHAVAARVAANSAPHLSHTATPAMPALCETTEEAANVVGENSDGDSVAIDNPAETVHTATAWVNRPLPHRQGSQPQRTVSASRTSQPKFTAKVYVGNTVGGKANQGEMAYLLADAAPIGPSGDIEETHGSATKIETVSTEETSVDHRQPVRYGASVRYQLNDRWSVEAGLCYSYLRSDLSTGNSTLRRSTAQKLHYVGIPVSVGYSIWRNRHFGVYASAAMTVEKMVSGTAATTTYENNAPTITTDERVSVKPLQLSVGAGVGGEYMLNSTIGVYVEPGLNYYFDNHSSVPTIYADKPLNFNLNIGLRLTLE